MVNKKGFTLVEIIIVLVIIAIIGAISFPAFSSLLKQSHEDNCIATRDTLTRKVNSSLILQDNEDKDTLVSNILIERGGKSISTLEYLGFCDEKGTYTLAYQEDTHIKITCSKHSDEN